MDLAQGSIGYPLLTVAELAARKDFALGSALVSPSTRTIAGPGGCTDLEPRVMQVLLVLADAGGRVVTRDELLGRCWGGVYVGDDSLNRAIGIVRRVARDVAGASFQIETVPRTGYRLLVGCGEQTSTGSRDRPGASVPRRAVIGGALAAAAAGGSGLWWGFVDRPNRQFDALMERGEQAMRDENADPRQIVRTFEEAVALNPASARAWGMLAEIKGALAGSAPAQQSAPLVEEAKRAAARSLAIDPNEPNALTALAMIEEAIAGWAKFDARLRHVLSIDPGHLRALSMLGVLTQGAGLNRESWTWNERALALAPLSPHFLVRRGMKLWILGRVPDADRVMDRVRALWPLDDWAFYIRFQIYALTGRAEAARAMLRGNEARIGPPAALSMWQPALRALEQPTVAHIARARDAILEAARLAPGLAAQGVMILASLRQVDFAFGVAEGLLLSRGPIVLGDQAGSRSNVNDPGWRWTPWLFTPPAAVMRADARFLPLCRDIGLADYWKARRVEPDYLLARN